MWPSRTSLTFTTAATSTTPDREDSLGLPSEATKPMTQDHGGFLASEAKPHW